MKPGEAKAALEAAGYHCEFMHAILYVRRSATAMGVPDRLYVRASDGEVSDIKVKVLLRRREGEQ